MQTISPRILAADLWTADGRLGKTLDALFSYREKDIAGLVMGYLSSDGYIVATGPAQVATRNDGAIHLFEDLPEDDTLAAAIGRAIQAIFSAGHLNDYLDNIQSSCPVSQEGQTLQALFTPNGLFLFQDDPWEVIENHDIDTEEAAVAAQLCTLVLRPALSSHAKVARSQEIIKEWDTYHQIQKTGLEVLKARNVATLMPPCPSDIMRAL